MKFSTCNRKFSRKIMRSIVKVFQFQGRQFCLFSLIINQAKNFTFLFIGFKVKQNKYKKRTQNKTNIKENTAFYKDFVVLIEHENISNSLQMEF